MGVFLKNEKVTAGQQRPLMSLRSLFGILFFLLMIGTILLSYLINMLLLESYYLTDRKKSLVRVYNELQSASVSELLTTDCGDCHREALRLLQTVRNDERAQNALGVALWLCGQKDEALSCLHRAAANGNADAQRNLRELEAN